jgi:hypothetical protein
VQFAKGTGCVKDDNWERGGIQRVTPDCISPLSHALYCSRLPVSRINSKAKELGIVHPKVRNTRSVANPNTLAYLVMNVRALQRAKAINAALHSTSNRSLQLRYRGSTCYAAGSSPYPDSEKYGTHYRKYMLYNQSSIVS